MADPSPSSSLDLLGDGFCTCSSVLLIVGDGVRLKDTMNSESRYLKEPKFRGNRLQGKMVYLLK